MGAVLSPEDSNELMRGIKTLSVRLDRQVENTKRLIQFLQTVAAVDKVYYPGIQNLEGYRELHQEAAEAGAVFFL